MTTYAFTPPRVDEGPAGEGRLFVRVKLARGVSILEGPPGSFRAVRFPTQDEITASQPHFFMGGHTYEVDADTRAALIAANIGVTGANFTPGYGTQVMSDPDRLQVLDDQGGILATLTVGAKTVAMRGPVRTFTEQKRTFTDDFARTVSSGFGQSPAGGTWLNLIGTDSNFSVNGSQGLILNDVANTGRYVSVHDDDVADFSAALLVTITATPAGASSSVAMTVGYQDSSNHYRARLLLNTTGTVQLVLERVVSGSTTTLGAATTVGTGFTANQLWHIRTQRTGSTIRCRAWLDGTSEPSTWTFSVTDTTYPTGRIGLRSLASTGSTVLPYSTVVENLTVDGATWGHPPSVTHDTWVRVLPEPFDGIWTQALASQVNAWAADTSPDVLAYTMAFITGAPAAAGPDDWPMGQAEYGPLAADGTRIEFSDWNDFLGFGWTYPDGEVRGFPHGSIAVGGCMDCSGFVRTVYGRLAGLPMSFDNAFDGLNIPRRTRDIGPSGPGVIIQQAFGVAPSLANLQVGDVVLFDADTNDPVEGQIDHCGIYLGVDAMGGQRFISSRKTVDGPTFSDLGGPSRIDGTGTYATRLRTIRRF